MYEVPNQNTLLYQGDIFRGNFVFPFILDPAEDAHLVREQRVIPASEAPHPWEAGSETILLPAYRTDFVVILSNTCEISGEKQPLEFVTVGAIFSIDTIPNRETRESCARNKIFRFHYLQVHECGPGASYVHFGILAQVRLEPLRNFRQNRVLTLVPPYRESLGHRFGEFLSRVAL